MRRQQRRREEREFGVPFPGEIVAPEAWTHTALKKLPDREPLDWSALFGRLAPVVLDLGCGNGRYLIGTAVWRPGTITWASTSCRWSSVMRLGEPISGLGQHSFCRQRRAGTVGPVHGAGQSGRDSLLSSAALLRSGRSPQTADHAGIPAVGPPCVAPGGSFFLQTDHPSYWRYMCQIVPVFFDLDERPACWPDAPKGRTRREIIALRRGLPVFAEWPGPKAGSRKPKPWPWPNRCPCPRSTPIAACRSWTHWKGSESRERVGSPGSRVQSRRELR